MAGNIKHRYTNPKSDSADTTITRPSNWNDQHDAITITEQDFGATPVQSGEWTVTDANVATTSHILAWLTAEDPTGRDGDEAEMEEMVVFAKTIAAGSFVLCAEAVDGPVDGKYKFGYIVA